MSAIKRDIGIKDFGGVIERRGGILDRIDSLCFAAPIFFHVVRYYFVRQL
jgi:phosphatidate cytidylyltransferase